MILSNKVGILPALISISALDEVTGHGYMKTPRARNYHANLNGKWWGGTATDPAPESCPHCLNVGGPGKSVCGIVGDHNYDLPPNAVGGLMPTVIQACYAPGSIIDVESQITAHHMGHFEMRACPITHGQVPTQACFDANPMTFISDELYGAVPDVNYPERAYIPRTDFPGGLNGNFFHHKYQLPAGLTGELVLLQWYWVTANSCKDEGYDDYPWPDFFYPGNKSSCSQPVQVTNAAEQFWNCAEVRISNDCDGTDPPEPTTTTSTTTTTSNGTGGTTTTSTGTTAGTTTTTRATSNPGNCATDSNVCGPNNPCGGGLCCSQWGFCGATEAYCGACCQSNCWGDPSPPTPTPPSPTTPTQPTTLSPTLPSYTANHGEDSRLIAYVGNWQSCPTDAQVDAYSHIVIAFSVSYTWSASKNNCNAQCNVGNSVPICNNVNNQALVDKWRSMGKKVIFSFGGAGMGGSWSGDTNNCWDYCFGKEEQLSTSLVNIVQNQKFDGIDIDYEYCYDVNGLQAGRCAQRSSLYTDAKAQTFLDSLTSLLRSKLDALQASNGYNRGRYEITHAPMDIDVSNPNSKYYQILKARRNDLDFLMPQFYNGVTRPGLDGVDGTGAGSMSAVSLFGNLANDLFDEEPHKVIFGFCISDCSGTGSNVNANQAVQVLSDLKTYNGGEFNCNGGAFFWVALRDTNGAWSDTVLSEVSRTAGCSNNLNPSTTTSTTVNTGATTTSTTEATPRPTDRPTVAPVTMKPTVAESTDMPTLLPTSSPVPTFTDKTPSPTLVEVSPAPTVTPPRDTSSPTSRGNDMVASFDIRLGTPRCASLATSCSSGDLLKGRGNTMGGAEANTPNTLTPCVDGSAGEYHFDESLDKIVVKSINMDGSDSTDVLTEGEQATIIATVYPVSNPDGTLSYDYADFYYTADASNPVWTYIGTESPDPSIKDTQELQLVYALPKGTHQAVRVNYRFLGDRGANDGCHGGPYDDTDDLVFAVKENDGITASPVGTVTASPTKKPSNLFCKGYTEMCGADKPCPNGYCCSEWGYCGTTEAYCGLCCQSGNCWDQ